MENVRIRPLRNGPVEVAGSAIEVVDSAGVARAAAEEPIYLCRCGQSADKPYCDGTHKKVGFIADGWARPSSKT